ncbi:hypothetical protein HYV74_04140 [Candidatus Uhrbacteria bacterium]|nr:hypothetical protein [Candidatus Uhrbacteria bacterium]
MAKPQAVNRDTAYLMIELATDVPVPFVRSVCIASQPSTSMTAKPGTYFEYMRMEGGESFEDAQRRLREYIRKIPDLQWMTQYLGSSEAGGDQFRAMCWREVAERAMRAVGGQVQFLIDLALRVQLR